MATYRQRLAQVFALHGKKANIPLLIVNTASMMVMYQMSKGIVARKHKHDDDRVKYLLEANGPLNVKTRLETKIAKSASLRDSLQQHLAAKNAENKGASQPLRSTETIESFDEDGKLDMSSQEWANLSSDAAMDMISFNTSEGTIQLTPLERQYLLEQSLGIDTVTASIMALGT